MDENTIELLRALSDLLSKYGAELFADNGVILLDCGAFETRLAPVVCREYLQHLLKLDEQRKIR